MKSPSNIRSPRRTRHMQVPYRKMHGTGNVILVVDQRARICRLRQRRNCANLATHVAVRDFDQMMWVFPADDEQSIARYRVFNADGSEVEQCGNGVRCVAMHLAGDVGQAQSFSLQSPTGAVEARVQSDGMVAVSMGAPMFDPAAIPFRAGNQPTSTRSHLPVTRLRSARSPWATHIASYRWTDVADAAVGEIGPQIEHHDRFPELTNVGFMHIRDRTSIDLRVHERGVGETQACGTGACAAVVVGQRLGCSIRTSRSVCRAVKSW